MWCGREIISEHFESSPWVLPVWLFYTGKTISYDSLEAQNLTRETSRELEHNESLSPPSHPLSCSLLVSSSFVFISALYVWFFRVVLLVSASVSSFVFFLLSLRSFILWLLPTSLSLALLVFLLSFLLTLFLHWLPTHSFFYASLLANARSRCSPRCLNRTGWAEPLKDLASAPRQSSPIPLVWSIFKTLCD